MTAHMQNPGGQAPASRDCFNLLSHLPDWREYILAIRIPLSGCFRQDMKRLCFGEGRSND